MVALALMTACVAPTSRLPTVNPAEAQAEAEKQMAVAIEEDDRLAQRLAQVAVPILAANTDQCGDHIRNRAGVQFKTALLNQSTAARRAAVAARGLSRAGEVRVAYTMPGMPADGVLFPGEIVTRINGISAYAALSGQAKVNYQLPHLRVSVVRDGQQLNINMPTVPVCSYRVILLPRDAINAAAANDTIFVTTGIMRLLDSDRDVALVFGHELAHLTRHHQDAQRANAAIGAMIAAVVSGALGVDVVDLGAKIGAQAYSQEFESEADYVGMYHASRAGWDMKGAANLFRRLAAAHPSSIHSLGGTHPSTVSRALLVEQTAREIESKRARNLALIPNYKGLPESAVPLAGPTLAARPPSTSGPPRAAFAPAASPLPTAVSSTVAGPASVVREDAETQFRRAVAFEHGDGRPQDYEQALKWYRKAGDQGHRQALFNLAKMYADGRGVRQNNGEAVIYLRRAAELKHAEAHYTLGFMEENGRGTAKDPTRGLTNYIVAVALGAGTDAERARDRLSGNLPRAQVTEAEQRARQWIDDHQR